LATIFSCVVDVDELYPSPNITLHKPHPANIVKIYVIDDILELLRKEEMI